MRGMWMAVPASIRPASGQALSERVVAYRHGIGRVHITVLRHHVGNTQVVFHLDELNHPEAEVLAALALELQPVPAPASPVGRVGAAHTAALSAPLLRIIS